MLEIIGICIVLILAWYLLNHKGKPIEENPVQWGDSRGYQIVKWGYTHGLGDAELSQLWVRVADKNGKVLGELVFDRNEEFEENYRHLQY